VVQVPVKKAVMQFTRATLILLVMLLVAVAQVFSARLLASPFIMAVVVAAALVWRAAALRLPLQAGLAAAARGRLPRRVLLRISSPAECLALTGLAVVAAAALVYIIFRQILATGMVLAGAEAMVL
jgi:hypothetical protein